MVNVVGTELRPRAHGARVRKQRSSQLYAANPPQITSGKWHGQREGVKEGVQLQQRHTTDVAAELSRQEGIEIQ